MSESFPVELNREAVHSIDAPESFTARGPFHIELSNAGGAVHVHVHLDDDLSRAVRLNGVNHYVEGGETKRVPVGTVPGRDEVTGHLEIVSGYGTERERVKITVDTAARDASHGEGRAATRHEDRDATDGDPKNATHGGAENVTHGDTKGATRTEVPESEPHRFPADEPEAGPTTGGDDAPGTVRASSKRRSRDHSMGGSRSGMGARGLAVRSLPDLPASLADASREELAFVGLAAVATLIGLAVILIVRDVLVAVVVAGVVTAAVAVVGWLLFE